VTEIVRPPDIRRAQASIWQAGIALEGPDTDTLTGDMRDNNGTGVHLSAGRTPASVGEEGCAVGDPASVVAAGGLQREGWEIQSSGIRERSRPDPT
jgi:hypothetical protein